MSPVSSATSPAVADALPDANDARREFVFSDADFQDLSRLAYQHAGIVLGESKRNLVYSRLSRRLRVLNLASFRAYRDHIAGNEREIENFINSISTNHTKFFRESHHFDHFISHVATPFGRGGQPGKRMRLWSAGCSSGEEPYTIAVTLLKHIPNIDQHDVRMLATDIDTDILAKAVRAE
jgi:chemotaxis protein methyltransferase CheR